MHANKNKSSFTDNFSEKLEIYRMHRNCCFLCVNCLRYTSTSWNVKISLFDADTNFDLLKNETEKQNKLLLHRLVNETGMS